MASIGVVESLNYYIAAGEFFIAYLNGFCGNKIIYAKKNPGGTWTFYGGGGLTFQVFHPSSFPPLFPCFPFSQGAYARCSRCCTAHIPLCLKSICLKVKKVWSLSQSGGPRHNTFRHSKFNVLIPKFAVLDFINLNALKKPFLNQILIQL